MVVKKCKQMETQKNTVNTAFLPYLPLIKDVREKGLEPSRRCQH